MQWDVAPDLSVIELFYNGSVEESQKKEKKTKTRIKVSTALNFIFRLMGTSAICIFGTHSMNFPSFTHLYKQTECDRLSVLRKTDFLFSFKPAHHLLLTKT